MEHPYTALYATYLVLYDNRTIYPRAACYDHGNLHTTDRSHMFFIGNPKKPRSSNERRIRKLSYSLHKLESHPLQQSNALTAFLPAISHAHDFRIGAVRIQADRAKRPLPHGAAICSSPVHSAINRPDCKRIFYLHQQKITHNEH